MIVIAGAGISGLTIAHHLAAAGIPHIVFEASERAGGVIRSGRIEGSIVEYGPQRARLSPTLDALVASLGIAQRAVSAPPDLPLFVLRDGRLHEAPLSPGSLLRTGLLGTGAKLRLLLEPFAKPARDDESIASFLTRRLGREAYLHFAGPLYGGLYASDPEDMIVRDALRPALAQAGIRRSLLPRLLRSGGRVRLPPALSFDDGLEVLTNALFERHRERIRLATPVRAIHRAAGVFRIEAGDDVVAADAVVLTTPADAASALLTGDASERLRALRYNPLAIVHMHTNAPLHGLGYQASLSENTLTRGVTCNHSLFAGRDGVCTAFLGGARHRDIAERDDEEVRSIAVREFEEATGRSARALAVSRARMPAWDRSWQALHGWSPPEGVHICANWWSRPGITGRLAEARRVAAALQRLGRT